MKVIPSTLVTTTLFSVWCIGIGLQGAAAQTAPAQGQAQVQTAPPQKRSFFSRFRRQAPPQQPVQQQQVVPPQQPQKRGFSFPKFRKPNLQMPKLSMPKVSMPKMKWPFKGRGVKNETVQNYPSGVRNPTLGGAYGVIRGQEVKFYEIGPSQPFGPDDWLNQGTVVTIRRNDRSWAYVTLEDGRSGYIGLDQVRMASAKEAPRARSAPSNKKRSQMVAQQTVADSKKYSPPALPSVAAELPPENSEPEFSNLLLDSSGEDELVEVEAPAPVDSPDVLFDPILDPIEPAPYQPYQGGAEPFLNDPIPSIEEELRAIEEAKAQGGESP